MQSIGWYFRRARTMSPAELAWRIRSELRDAVDACRVPLRLYPRTDVMPRALPAAPRWCPVPLGDWANLAPDDPAAAWRDRLIARADRIAAHRLSFFDLEDVDLGTPIDWNRDHACQRSTPTGFAAAIDYRDYAVAGDAKVVWEPNRHHQFVVLGRAFRATGDRKYAAAIVEQLGSWIDQCPFGTGMNWRSPLELAVRVVNWTWALDLIVDCGLLTEAFRARVFQAIGLHVWEIARKYSRGTSANNHRIGEACGVFVATSYFPELPDASRLREESRRILAEEIVEQTYPSGATREQALGYQLFVLQLFLYAGLADRRTDRRLPAQFWDRLQRMFGFVEALARGGPLPMYGDADDGYVLDLGDPASDVDALRDLAAHVFHAGDGAPSSTASETTHWLFGSTADTRRRGIASAGAPTRLESTAFEDAGLYVLQWGDMATVDRVSVVFDCGELGFGGLAAHGHADALSIAVRAFGVDVLVDPGTYDYFTFPEWRRYFRGTRAHNTVTVDGGDQSAQLGSFLWGRRATARVLRWGPRPDGGVVAGEHDGYADAAGVTCRRTLELDGRTRTLTILDEIAGRGGHDVELRFHFAEQCTMTRADHELLVDCGAGTAVLRLDERLTLTTTKGGEVGEGGWVSRGYHRRTAAWCVSGRVRIDGAIALRSVLTFGEPSTRTDGDQA